MHLPRVLTTAAAALQTREFTLPVIFSLSVSQMVQTTEKQSTTVLLQLSDAGLYPPLGGPSWDDVQGVNPGTVVADANDAKRLGPLADGYLDTLTAVLTAKTQVDRVNALTSFQNTLKSIKWTYNDAYDEVAKATVPVVPLYNDLANKRMKSWNDQLTEVNSRIKTLKNNLGTYDDNIMKIVDRNGVKGIFKMNSIQAWRDQFDSVVYTLWSNDIQRQLDEQIDLREQHEQTLSNYELDLAFLQESIKAVETAILGVDNYLSLLQTTRTGSAGRLNDYVNWLKRDTTSVLQWAQTNAQGTTSGMPAIISSFRSTGTCYYSGDHERWTQFGDGLLLWVGSRV